ncbi:Uncharacterised protein [uncultured archaeon]|nr:Uncharacterised protein [uncultured archaeon]
MMFKKNRRAQEEMVGFAVIVIIVGIILIVLLGFMIGNKNNQQGNVESYEIESFIQASLQYSSSCGNELEFLSVQQLINACDSGTICLDNQDSCDTLNQTIKGLIDSGWSVGNGSAIKGYQFKVMSEGNEKLIIQKGNETSNYKGGFQDFASGVDSYEVSLKVYY